LGSGTDSAVHSLAVDGSNLYAGGLFTNAGGATANHIAKWDGSAWSTLGGGIDDAPGVTVDAIAIDGTDIYAGGGFLSASGTTVNNIARWSGSAWWALGSGTDLSVFALSRASTGTIYCGGTFLPA